MKLYNVAVAGATGLVGRTFLKVLEEYNFPINNLILYASARSKGKVVTYCGKEYVKLIVHSKDNNPKNLALDNYELLCRDCYNKVSTFGYYNYNNIRKQNKEKLR